MLGLFERHFQDEMSKNFDLDVLVGGTLPLAVVECIKLKLNVVVIHLSFKLQKITFITISAYILIFASHRPNKIGHFSFREVLQLCISMKRFCSI